MKHVLKSMGMAGAAVIAFSAAPERLSLHPAAAVAGEIICTSSNYQYSYCGGARVGNNRPVVIEQLSRAPCDFGRSWGYDQQGVWVDKGCAAHFGYGDSRRSSSAGSVVGAAVVGGLIGALLGSSGDQSHSRNNYDRSTDRTYRPYPVVVERRSNNDYVDPTSRFDKDGNPNFDTDGNYQGAHGLGALVDNPDTPSN